MENIIKLPGLAWYGARKLELPLPASWQVEVLNMSGYNRLAMSPDEIRAALNKPIGAPPLRELAKGRQEVVIIFDDMTRATRTAEIVPLILEELAGAGIPDKRIRFVAALGCHGAMDRLDFVKKLGEATLARFPVYNHNQFNNCVPVGTTSGGLKLFLNAEVIGCDLKIGIGSVTPHPYAGFGGGGKIILPGVASFETIESLHTLVVKDKKYRDKPVTGMGVFDNNPVRFNIEEAARLAGLDFKIDCIHNTWGETVAIFAGAPIPAHAAAVQIAKTHYLTPRVTNKDIVIANTFTKANEAFLGLSMAFPAVSAKGGDVVLIGNAVEGQVTHYLLGSFGRTTAGKLRLQVRLPPHINHLILYTQYPDLAGRGYFEESDRVIPLSNWDEVLELLQKSYRTNPRVAIYPNAEIQYCALASP